MNGTTVFLDRPLELLATSADRPLSSDRELLEKRYHERYARYNEVADLVICADQSPGTLCQRIIKELKQ